MAAYAAPPSAAVPPTSPEVSEQQNPLAQFLQNQGSPDQQAGAPGVNAMNLVEQKLNQVAAELKEVAKILVQNKPNAMPLLQKMLQAGSMLANEIQAGKPQNQAGQPGVQRQPPEPSGNGIPSPPTEEGGSPAMA